MTVSEELLGRIRATLDARNRARDEALVLSRECIRNCANSIRAAHRGELERAGLLLDDAKRGAARLAEALGEHPELYYSGYVHDCQKEVAEASAFLAVIAGEPLPEPEELGVEYAAYLNGLGETVGEMRRHTLDQMRQGRLERACELLAAMDEIYHSLVTVDYPDALTGGLRRTTDGVRGIIEKTRGELTTALLAAELRRTIERALDESPSGSREAGT